MENTHQPDNGQYGTDPEHDWQNAERHNDAEDNTIDLRSAEAGGYKAEDWDDALYAGPGDRDKDDDKDDGDQNEEDNADNEDEDEPADWGNIDPLSDNSPFPSDMDPSGPGSAV